MACTSSESLPRPIAALRSCCRGRADQKTRTASCSDDDSERLLTLAKQLTAVPSRELAYSVAHLLTISDVAIAPEEDDMLVDLRTALDISEDRAEELARVIGAAVTPEN